MPLLAERLSMDVWADRRCNGGAVGQIVDGRENRDQTECLVPVEGVGGVERYPSRRTR